MVVFNTGQYCGLRRTAASQRIGNEHTFSLSVCTDQNRATWKFDRLTSWAIQTFVWIALLLQSLHHAYTCSLYDSYVSVNATGVLREVLGERATGKPARTDVEAVIGRDLLANNRALLQQL